MEPGSLVMERKMLMGIDLAPNFDPAEIRVRWVDTPPGAGWSNALRTDEAVRASHPNWSLAHARRGLHDRGIVHRPDLNIPRADRLRSDFDYHQAGRMTSVWPVLATSPHRLNARRSVDSRCGRGRSIQPRSRRPAGRWTGNLSGRRGHTLCRPATNECVPAVRQCGPELVDQTGARRINNMVLAWCLRRPPHVIRPTGGHPTRGADSLPRDGARSGNRGCNPIRRARPRG
jgi:hypothetical protein